MIYQDGADKSNQSVSKQSKSANSLHLWWFKLRVKIANKLVKLAHKIRPKTANQMMQILEDEFMYGTGIGRFDPKSFYKSKGD